MTKEPKFCRKCGEKLLVSAKISNYDAYTGDKRLASKTFKCPHYNRILDKVFRRGHDSSTLDLITPMPPKVALRA